MKPQRKWLIIDTDAGVDDAFALCMSLLHDRYYGYDLKLITTSFGNVNVD